MRYKSGVTTVRTTAAEALALGQGLCQDYAHLMLAVCRTAGLPARYVSGHLLGEGGSHAWVEVFLPTETGLSAVAFDPTNKRQPHLGYVTVAVGRDYQDVSPTSGSFTAPYGGQLTCSKRAGLTLVEYLNGDTLTSTPGFLTPFSARAKLRLITVLAATFQAISGCHCLFSAKQGILNSIPHVARTFQHRVFRYSAQMH